MATSPIEWIPSHPHTFMPHGRNRRSMEAELEYSRYIRNPGEHQEKQNIPPSFFNLGGVPSRIRSAGRRAQRGARQTCTDQGWAQISKAHAISQYKFFVFFVFFLLPFSGSLSGVGCLVWWWWWCSGRMYILWTCVSNDPHVAQWHNTRYMGHMDSR